MTFSAFCGIISLACVRAWQLVGLEIRHRSWKFVLQSDTKTREPLAIPDFVGAPKKQKNKQSNQISKNLIKPMISVERQFHIRRVIEVVITRRSWKPFGLCPREFESHTLRHNSKSLENLMFSRLFTFFNLNNSNPIFYDF